MATVYLAHDLKHDRDVAIKVLHPDLGAALGGERFLSEIRTTARLQHPHILPLLDSGAADGLLYYVMPVVTGETLRARLEREHQLPIPDAVRVAREVASALDYAHRQGVIHRDIKPENILLHEGQALVADFGIALAVQSAGGARMTQTGLSLGTPQYMSPEQAMGERTIDARADIYALGAMTYEMLTGDAPFTGSTVQAIVAKVLSAEPERPSMTRKTIPPHLEGAVLTALAKLPADRFATAAEFAAALQDRNYAPEGTAALGAAGARGAASRASNSATIVPSRFALAAMTAVTVLALAAALWGWRRPQATPALARLDLTVGPVPLSAGSDVLISPDGSMLAYVGQVGSSAPAIFLRRLGGAPDFKLVAGTEGATQPSFSPDNEWIVFRRMTTNGLEKVSVSGGGVSTIETDLGGSFPHWGSGDTIVFGSQQGIFVVAAAGGAAPKRLPNAGGRLPFLLPDGSGVLSTRAGDAVLYDIATDSTTVLVPNASYPLYARSGHLLYTSQDGGLFAVRFDLARHRITGTPARVVDRVAHTSTSRGYSVSDKGTLVQFDAEPSGQAASLFSLLKIHRFGGRTDTVRLPRARHSDPRLSPDGRFIAYASGPTVTELQLHVADLVTGTNTQLTFGGNNRAPIWSPSGRRVIYAKDSAGVGSRLYIKSADGSGVEEPVEATGMAQVPTAWPSEDLIVYEASTGSASGRDLFTLALKNGAAPTAYVAAPYNESALSVSPDGTLAAFVARESGRDDVWIREFPAAVSKWLATSSGGTHPRWSRDGKSLYFWRAGTPLDTLFRVRIDRSPSVVIRAPEVVATIDASGIANWDVLPDGSRFILAEPDVPQSTTSGANADAARSRHLVVLNWFNELTEKAKERRP